MVMNDVPFTREEVEWSLLTLVDMGLAEMSVNEEGEFMFRITEKGAEVGLMLDELLGAGWDK